MGKEAAFAPPLSLSLSHQSVDGDNQWTGRRRVPFKPHGIALKLNAFLHPKFDPLILEERKRLFVFRFSALHEGDGRLSST